MARSETRAARILSRGYLQSYPREAAEVLDGLPPDEVAVLLEEQAPGHAAVLLARVRTDRAAEILESAPETLVREVLPTVEPVRAAAAVARLAPAQRARLLALVDPAAARELTTLMTFTPDTAGSLMDPRVTTFLPDATVTDALSRLRGLKHKRIADVFVVDGEGRLVGPAAVQDIAVSDPSDRLGALVRTPPVSILATAPQAEVVEVLETSRVASLPVVDFHGRVLGVIRHDALVSAAQADATADMQTMVGVSREERALSRVSFAVRRRLPWLQMNLVTAFIAAAVVGLFEGTIARFTALAVLLPVVAGQSGNTGAQALAVTMRGLALREIRPRQWWRVAGKEVAAGVINGAAVSIVTGIAVFVWSGSPGLAAVIATAMIVSMAVAGLAGASIPMVLTILGQDPAQASSIILTTVTDVVGFLSFLGLATAAAGAL